MTTLADTSRTKTVTALLMAGLIGVVAALYWPVAGYEFVNWDDPWYVLKNPLIKSWSFDNLWRIATEMSVKNYAPLTTLSLLVDHTLFGLEPGGYHLHNVVLHAINAVLVFGLVRRLTTSSGIGMVTAVLFAIHPIQVETVAWVSSRKTLLCSTFMLASALCWLREDRETRHEMWGIGFLALALLAKAAAIVMPPIVIAYDLLIRRRKLAEAIPPQLFPACLCILLLNITMSAQSEFMGGVRGHMELSKLHILGIDSIILWRYVGMLIAPFQLSLLYDPATTGIATSVTWSILGWSLVGLLCWHWRKSRPGFAFAVIVWFCLLAPVLNFFPITTLMNDRYLYLPCLCFFTLAAVAGRHVLAWGGCFDRDTESDRRSFGQLATNGLAGATITFLVIGYATLTAQRLPVWKDDVALWKRTVAQVPQLPVVQIQWADSLHRNGHERAAVAALRLTLSKYEPDDADRKRIWDRLDEWDPQPSPLSQPTTFVSLESETED